MHRRLSVLLLGIGTVACRDRALPTQPGAPTPGLTIADAPRGSTAGFYWLPPLVRMPALGAGTFDPALSPTVEICELAGAGCGRVLATYTRTSGQGSETVRLDASAQHYLVTWHTRDFDLSTTVRYRISVRAGADVLLGYADVQPVGNGKVRQALELEDVFPISAGQTFPIKFRIETGIVGQVRVTPPVASLEVGETKQFVATVRDLHDNPVNAAVMWTSSQPVVGAVDATGLASALGAGEAVITATAGRVSGNATLVVTAAGDIAALEAGEDFTCALNRAGKAYCWGWGQFDQLGNGAAADQSTPTPVSGSLSFGSISGGGAHTCAITRGGQAYCWGSNRLGELGTGTVDQQPTPTPVVGGLAFTSISAGGNHTCATTATGQAYCWGWGLFGELGDGALTKRLTPTPVAGGLAFASISAGRDYTCALTTSGQAYCWGVGSSGQLGTGATASSLTPIAVTGGLTFRTITTGYAVTCAVATTGQGYCWGRGFGGLLGTGSTTMQLSPASVAGNLTFTGIGTGFSTTCGATPSGQAYCWGGGALGQVGDGAAAPRLTPSAVAGGLRLTSVSVGAYHACGVSPGGHGYCWGGNRHGQLGTGAPAEPQPTPVPIAPLP